MKKKDKIDAVCADHFTPACTCHPPSRGNGFADWEKPVFDGPRKKQPEPIEPRLNTENDGE